MENSREILMKDLKQYALSGVATDTQPDQESVYRGTNIFFEKVSTAVIELGSSVKHTYHGVGEIHYLSEIKGLVATGIILFPGTLEGYIEIDDREWLMRIPYTNGSGDVLYGFIFDKTKIFARDVPGMVSKVQEIRMFEDDYEVVTFEVMNEKVRTMASRILQCL